MSTLVRAGGNVAKHLPASHPVRRRLEFQARLIAAIDREGVELPPVSAMAISRMSDRIEHIATEVAALPEHALTAQQRRSLHLIAQELTRLASTTPERSCVVRRRSASPTAGTA